MVFEGLIQKLTQKKMPKVVNLDDYVELEIPGGYQLEERTIRYIKVRKLRNFSDIDIATQDLSTGNVVILDIKPLAEKNINELKLAIDEIKEIVKSMNGDIAGLSEYLLILTPSSIKIDRGEKKEVSSFEEAMERVRKRAAHS